MNRTRIPFDLKLGKLQGMNWERKNMQELGKQLFERQGEYRASIENRLYVLFDRSATSSTQFLELNQPVIVESVIKMLRDPVQYWFPLKYAGQQVLVCIILIPLGKYSQLIEISEHFVGDGLREPDKAEFHKKLLKVLASASGGTITPNQNENEHGVDGYIELPSNVANLYGGV